MNKRCIYLFLLFAAFPLWADSEIESSGSLQLQVSNLPEAKLRYTQNFNFPLFQGEGPLTEGNNLNLGLTAELSPLSLNGIAEAVLTPVAFLQLAAGGRIGSGWNFNLFGNDIYGIGINRRGGNRKPETLGSSFDGLLWSVWSGAAFQFDLAALLPGDWHHVVFRTYHEARYSGYTAASAADSWYFENDNGENRNGLSYYGNYLLGYQIPFLLDTLGFMAEMKLFLYNTPNGREWGDNLPQWIFGPVFNFTLTKRLNATLAVQFRTRRNYHEGSEDNLDGELFYQDRHIKKTDPYYVSFYRVAAILTYTLR